MAKTNVAKLRKQMVNELRAYSESQAETWRQIPWMALQADGRTGWSDSYASAYRHGYWRLLPVGGYYQIFIDLETGELVASHDPTVIVHDDLVASLREDDLDATALLKELQQEAKRPLWKGYDPDELAQKKKEIAKEARLEKVYKRGGPRVKLPFVWD